MHHYIPLLLILFASGLQAEPFADSPDIICQWMNPERFAGSGKYTRAKDDLYRCATLRKPINRGEPPGSDVRYVAQGTATAIGQVRLELRMRSFRQPQQTLKRFHAYADALTRLALSIGLPEEAGRSIRSGVIGEWQISGKTIRLEKSHVVSGSYDFVFSIQ
jgi:hypothetical protein